MHFKIQAIQGGPRYYKKIIRHYIKLDLSIFIISFDSLQALDVKTERHSTSLHCGGINAD